MIQPFKMVKFTTEVNKNQDLYNLFLETLFWINLWGWSSADPSERPQRTLFNTE